MKNFTEWLKNIAEEIGVPEESVYALAIEVLRCDLMAKTGITEEEAAEIGIQIVNF